MALVRQTSFAFGELSPTLYGRTDLPQYAQGLRQCLNFFISKHGAAVSRPGMEFVHRLGSATPATSVRLIPFVVSEDESFVLAMHVTSGGGLIWIFKNGVLVEDSRGPVTLSVDYDASEVEQLKYAQVGMFLTLVHPNHPPREIRFGGASDDDWHGPTTIRFDAPKNFVDGYSDNPPQTDTNSRRWEYLSTWTLVARDGSLHETEPRQITLWLHKPTEQWFTIPDEFTVSPEKPLLFKPLFSLTRPSGNWTWPWDDDFVGIASWNLYRGRGGVFGHVGSMSILPTYGRLPNLTDDGVEDRGDDPDYTRAPPQGRNPFRVIDSSGDLLPPENPTAVAFFENRQVFGGTKQRPSYLWFSQQNSFLNFDRRLAPIVLSTDAFEFQLASTHKEQIRSMVGIDALLVFTDSSVWAVSSGGGGTIGPADFVARRQLEIGASWLQPVLVGGHVLYVRTKGNGVRNVIFDDRRRAYVGSDVSLFADHLMRDHQIVDWAYAADPWGVIWAVRSDGKLLSLTYVPEMGVWGWALHETDGKVKAVCTVPENGRDVLYLVVDRDGDRFVERMADRRFEHATLAFCLDAAKERAVLPASKEFSGFDHLAGRTVKVLADGQVIENVEVGDDGTIEIPVRANRVIVGLPYVCRLETLDVAGARTDQKIVRKVAWEVEASRGVWVGEDADHMTEWRQRQVSDHYNEIQLYTGEIEMAVAGRWNKHGRVVIEQRDPLPLTVLGITREIVVGGG